MKKITIKRYPKPFAILTASLILLASTSTMAAEAQADNQDRLHVLIAPYAWAMGVSGTVGINGISVPLDLQSTELMRGVKSGGMGYLQVQYGNKFVYLESLAVSFGQPNFQQFFNQTIKADLLFAEAGFGWNIPLESSFIGAGQTTISPYVGVRSAKLKIKVDGPLLVQTIKEEWNDPVVGVIVQGPVWRQVGYAVKIDAAGFNTDGDNYRSALAILRYSFNKSWAVAAGYRVSHFKSESNSPNGLAIDMTGSGPLVGIQFTY